CPARPAWPPRARSSCARDGRSSAARGRGPNCSRTPRSWRSSPMADESGRAGDTPLERYLRSQAAQVKKLARRLHEPEGRAGALEAERDAAVKDRDAGVAAAKKEYDATGLKQENERLGRQVLEQAHRAVYDRVAADKGVHPDARDLVYRELGYK